MKSLVIALCLFSLFGCSVREPRVETGTDKYAALTAEWAPSGLVSHFPSSLPAHTSKLSAFPGYMQGGAWFQVRLTLAADEVSQAYDAAAATARDFYDGGDKFKSVNSMKRGLAGTGFHTSDSGKSVDFPDDYRVFVSSAESFGDDTWNHGRSYGVVISKQRNEVIYFAEKW